MIIEFSVSNFRSIYEKISLSLLATKLTGKEATKENFFTPEKYKDIPILKSASIYGANASGKSNVLLAMKFVKDFIANSIDLKYGDELPHDPFRLLKQAATEPSVFEVEFIANDKIRYIYGFSFDRKSIHEEYLISFISRKPTEVFMRKKGEDIRFSSSFKGQKKSLEEQLQSNHLLLTKAANNNFEQVHPVYSFFTANMNVYGANYIDSTFSKQKSFEDEYYKKNIIQFMKVADTCIDSIEVTIKDSNFSMHLFNQNLKETIQKFNTYETMVSHNTSDHGKQEKVKWSLDQESAGTIKLFELAGPIIEILNNGHTLIFDEINNSLHPLITEFIVQLFNNEETNPNNAQLIFTTHDTTLLNKDIFRRDQIWFIEKDNRGMSQLYSLSSFDKKEVRWDVPFDKWYLSGRFGALPVINDLKLKNK